MPFDELYRHYPELLRCRDAVHAAYGVLETSFEGGGKLLACGNGGSASDAEHMVGELMKDFEGKRPLPDAFRRAYGEANGEEAPAFLSPALPAISLCSQTSLISALGNDCGYMGVFAQQVLGYGKEGDVLLSFSTSGNSANVVEAVKVARALGMATIAITGAGDSRLSSLCDVAIRLPADGTAFVQELTLPVYHALCRALEDHFWGGAL